MQRIRRSYRFSSNYGTSNIIVSCLLIVSSLQVSWCQNTCSSGPCYPPPADISGRFNVTANSTCGDPLEQFCVDLNCDSVCNANNPDLIHPASFVNDIEDGVVTFWKAKNFEFPVVLELDIGRKFMLYRSVVTFFHELPAAMYFLKSNDSGRTYRPISYFATNCTQYFNLPETPENDRDGLKVQCFKIDPGTNPSKQIYYSPMQDVNTAQDILTDSAKQAFFLMTNLKIVLVKFVTPIGFDPATVSDSLKQSFFFAISDWDVLASCECNGQASECDVIDPSKCICERNTAGHHCERCLSLFNNKPYQFREACESCGCNNHSQSCSYNESKGYGVCVDCQHNTMGDKCEWCKPTHYRNQGVPFSSVDACLACECHVPGVNNSADSSRCGNVTGQCACKSQVEGRVCDTCRDEFWNLSASNEQGCEDCGCNTTGTVNASNVCHKVNGTCPCKPLLTGRTCNQCKDGYFGLPSRNSGCSACNCNAAGSVNNSCTSTGQCFCRPRFSGNKCGSIENGFFVPSVDFVTFEAEDATIMPPQQMRINHTTFNNTAGDSVLVVGVVLSEAESGASPANLSFMISLPATGFYSLILRYMTIYNWELIKLTALQRTSGFVPYSCSGSPQVTRNEPHILFSNVSSASQAVNFGSRCLSGGQYKLDLEIPSGSAVPAGFGFRRRRAVSDKEIVVDSLVVMPTINESDAFREASPAVRENMTYYYNKSFELRTWSAVSQEGGAALSPVFGEFYGEGQACNCSMVGSDNAQQCDQNGGKCSCKPNVIGRTCSTCRPDYFNFTSGQGCQACDCDMIGANETSCDPATGQCSCRESVTGLHCDRCEQYYYNFNSGMGCSPCSCHPTYSSDLQCDGSSGVCSCKPGINGGKCTGCADRFYNLTDAGCTSCLCNPAGSDNPICNKTTGQCPCKAQSLGRVCDECPAGYYGLNLQNPDGCLKCQCSNKSSSCVSDAGWFVSQIASTLDPTVPNIDTDGWSASDGAGVSVATEWSWIPLIFFTRASIRVDTSSAQEIYFDAPAKYLGDQRFAYTFSLFFQLQQDNSSSPAASSRGDVILRGRWFDQPLITTLDSPPPGGDRFRTYEIELSESYWRVGNTSGRQPTSYEMIVVLSDLTSLRIRAKWTSLNTQLFSRIGDISLKLSNRTTVLSTVENASNVERCSCPPEYEGQFCERCKAGYTRVTPRGGPYVACVPCMCNNHSNTCDPETGVCQNCQHDTTGDHCERCTDGWYGNATNGTSQDCSPCPCPSRPGAPNQFARTCVLDSDGLPTCVNCTTGHEGRRCETCMDGYYGRPMEQNGQCRLCECSDNIDLGSSGNCNTTSGECLKCLHNTTGFNCEWCAPKFYGNALNKTCTGCNCSNVGAISNVCNNVTGNCDCQPHVTGMLCDECEQNAFNFTSSGCMSCDCDVDGSSDLQCDSMYGNCSCRSNVIGTKCDMCRAGFFDVTQRCQGCDCTANQTEANTTCDAVSGQCHCLVSVEGGEFGGRQCDACAVHTVGSPPSCYPCTEQCYLNWYNTISNETAKVDKVDKEVTAMLESFGSMSVDHLNITLQELYQNVSYANSIFQRGGREDLQEKQEQIVKIQNSISVLQRQLNDSKVLIDDALEYLTDHVVNFNGSVRIIPTTPMMYPAFPAVCPHGGGLSVIVDWRCIEAMALSYRRRALDANESGHANYTSIMSSYDVIQLANNTAYLAAREIKLSLDRLERVSDMREQVEAGLGDSFENMYQNHSLRLDEIRRITEVLANLLSEATNLGEQATTNVTNAERIVGEARNLAVQRKREAQTALDNANTAYSDALQAHSKADTALTVSTAFKENATRVLNQTQDALRSVTAGINTIARVNNMTQEAVSIADEVRGMSMPVTLQEIQDLADNILNTNVSELLVNQTLQEAEKGLQQAREVEQLSKRAVNVSRETLNTVEEIERTTDMSEESRNEARALQLQTDGMITDINNITQTVEQHFSAAYSAGQNLSTEINRTLETLEETLVCFDTAKKEAQNASNMAESAYNTSKDAKEMFDSSVGTLPPAAALVNSSYDNASSSLAEVEQAHRDSEQLLKNITEAEVLLEQYIAQRTELERLGQEMQQLDSEADELLAQFSVAADRYGQCAGA